MIKLQAYMPSQAEIEQARAWLQTNRSKIPPVLRDLAGSKIRHKPGRFLPIVPFDEDDAGLTNHRLNANGHESLLPWPGLDAVRNTINLRPVEDQFDAPDFTDL